MSNTEIRHSAIYAGKVRHRRFGPVEREFAYDVEMFYLDLDEVEAVVARHPLYSTRRRGPASFLRSDYLGSPGWPLRESVVAEVQSRTGWTPDGPIRLLTNLRQWGVLANPVSFYYCFEEATGNVRAVVAEVTNTPWGDRHTYVLQAGERPSRVLRGNFDKSMHVSPLMGMDQVHEIWVGEPGETLSVHIANHEDGDVIFDATLNLERRTLDRKSMTGMITGLPMPFRTLAGIYTQAARAFVAGVPFHSRPEPAGPGEVPDLPERDEEGMICPMHSDVRSHSDLPSETEGRSVRGGSR